MSDGDLYMTVTVEGTGVPVLVQHPITGRAGDDTRGTLARTRGNTAQDTHGDDAQEYNGRPKRGQTGRVS